MVDHFRRVATPVETARFVPVENGASSGCRQQPAFPSMERVGDAFQIAPPIVTGGEDIISAGELQ
jgi:hypothetical protein